MCQGEEGGQRQNMTLLVAHTQYHIVVFPVEMLALMLHRLGGCWGPAYPMAGLTGMGCMVP